MDMLTSSAAQQGLLLGAIDFAAWANFAWQFVKVLAGFSLIVFVHELGHFLAAKWCGVRVDRFAVGFGPRLFGWRKGEGLTFGGRPNYTAQELAARGLGETDYCFQALPLGGYVKMLGETDFDYDEKTGEVKLSDDPRSFPNKPVGSRMLVVSAGVVFNLLFAALALMTVFLVGHRLVAPVIGYVQPGMAGELAGLRPGDVIKSINGQKVDYWQDVRVREVLSTKPLTLGVERDGVMLPRPIVVKAEHDPVLKAQSIGVDCAVKLSARDDWPQVGDKPGVKKNDRFLSIDGAPVKSMLDIEAALLRSRGAMVTMRVARPSGDAEDAPTTELDVYIQPKFRLLPDTRVADLSTEVNREPHASLLGFVPRAAIASIREGRAAHRAGLKNGDVIARINRINAPTPSEILEQIEASEYKPVTIEVARKGETISATVRPEPAERMRLFGASRPTIGIYRPFNYETDRLLVARVEPGSPAAASGIIAGSELIAVAGVEVSRWEQVYLELVKRHGESVPLRYSVEGQILETTIQVPRTILSELNLPTDAMILTAADKRTAPLGGDRVALVGTQAGLEAALRDRAGQRVRITYADNLGQGEERSIEFEVRPECLQMWERTGRWDMPGPIGQTPVTWPVSAGGNPVRALWMGLKVTVQQVSMTYQTMQQVANQRVSTENLSGPIGIFNVAIEQAANGWRTLLLFFAFLSVNLAVLNFLPLPVLDGGLMVLLILEKIRGKPLTLKTQTQITLAGLALIGIVFVVVTFQDIAKLMN